MNIALLNFYEQRAQQPPYDFNNNYYGFKHTNGSDMSAHMPFLSFIAKDLNHITEFGTRECYSTSAFLLTCSGKVVSYDINIYKDILELQQIVPKDKWQFIKQDTTDPDFKIDNTDLLFIDSLHTYNQVKLELLQAKFVNKYIGFHDTFSHGKYSLDVPGEKGIIYAINEFLENNSEWKIVYQVQFNHGLVILEKYK